MEQFIPWIISALSLLVAGMTYFRNGRKDITAEKAKDDARFDGIKESLLKANMKLDQVCATTNETRSDIKSLSKDLAELDRRVSVVERDVKTAFTRIDEIRKEH